MVYRWHSRFLDGRTNVHDEKWSKMTVISIVNTNFNGNTGINWQWIFNARSFFAVKNQTIRISQSDMLSKDFCMIVECILTAVKLLFHETVPMFPASAHCLRRKK